MAFSDLPEVCCWPLSGWVLLMASSDLLYLKVVVGIGVVDVVDGL
jgi:hypothetical protein